MRQFTVLPCALLFAFALTLFAAPAAEAQTRDVAGSHDYAGIGRFGGSVVTAPILPLIGTSALRSISARFSRITPALRFIPHG